MQMSRNVNRTHCFRDTVQDVQKEQFIFLEEENRDVTIYGLVYYCEKIKLYPT